MGLFKEWMRARMYRKEITKGIREALEPQETIDFTNLIPTGKKILIFRNVIKGAKKNDIGDIYNIMYEIVKEDTQRLNRFTIEKVKPHKILIHLQKKLDRPETEISYELKLLKNKLMLIHKIEVRGWGRSFYQDQIEELESSFKELIKSIEDILG